MEEIAKRENALFEQVSRLIDEARSHVRTAVNTTMVYTYYGVGQYIVEDEQQGEKRAGYGKAVLKDLSQRLTEKYGEGWSVETLKKCRFFFNVYSPEIGSTLSTQSVEQEKSATVLRISQKKIGATVLPQSKNTPTFTLSWSHYLVLMRIENPDERSFYEIECRNQNWSVRQLQRQYNSSLYERLALSRDKALLQAKMKEWIEEFEQYES